MQKSDDNDSPKRDRWAKVRLTVAEEKLLKVRAVSHGSTASELIRSSAIYGKEISPIIIDTTSLKQTLFELQKQGNNLNQYMKFLNTFGEKGYEEKAALRVLGKVESTIDQIDRIIQELREGGFGHERY